LVKH